MKFGIKAILAFVQFGIPHLFCKSFVQFGSPSSCSLVGFCGYFGIKTSCSLVDKPIYTYIQYLTYKALLRIRYNAFAYAHKILVRLRALLLLKRKTFSFSCNSN